MNSEMPMKLKQEIGDFFFALVNPRKIRKFTGRTVFIGIGFFVLTFWLLFFPVKIAINEDFLLKQNTYHSQVFRDAGLFPNKNAAFDLTAIRELAAHFETETIEGEKLERVYLVTAKEAATVVKERYQYEKDGVLYNLHLVFDPANLIGKETEAVKEKLLAAFPHYDLEKNPPAEAKGLGCTKGSAPGKHELNYRASVITRIGYLEQRDKGLDDAALQELFTRLEANSTAELEKLNDTISFFDILDLSYDKTGIERDYIIYFAREGLMFQTPLYKATKAGAKELKVKNTYLGWPYPQAKDRGRGLDFNTAQVTQAKDVTDYATRLLVRFGSRQLESAYISNMFVISGFIPMPVILGMLFIIFLFWLTTRKSSLYLKTFKEYFNAAGFVMVVPAVASFIIGCFFPFYYVMVFFGGFAIYYIVALFMINKEAPSVDG